MVAHPRRFAALSHRRWEGWPSLMPLLRIAPTGRLLLEAGPILRPVAATQAQWWPQCGAVVYRGTGTSDDTYVQWRVAAHPVDRIVSGYQQQKIGCSSSEGKKTGDLTYQFAEL